MIWTNHIFTSGYLIFFIVSSVFICLFSWMWVWIFKILIGTKLLPHVVSPTSHAICDVLAPLSTSLLKLGIVLEYCVCKNEPDFIFLLTIYDFWPVTYLFVLLFIFPLSAHIIGLQTFLYNPDIQPAMISMQCPHSLYLAFFFILHPFMQSLKILA